MRMLVLLRWNVVNLVVNRYGRLFVVRYVSCPSEAATCYLFKDTLPLSKRGPSVVRRRQKIMCLHTQGSAEGQLVSIVVYNTKCDFK